MDLTTVWIVSAIVIAILSGLIGGYAMRQIERLDVATGRRTEFDIAQDYGSNVGFYWPWTPLYALAMLSCVVPSGYLALVFLLWVARS